MKPVSEEGLQTVARALELVCQEGERLVWSVRGESSTFCRFNHGKIRQLSLVEQGEANLSLQSRQRRASVELVLPAQTETLVSQLPGWVDTLRDTVAILPEDPHAAPTPPPSTSSRHDPDPGQAEAADIAANIVAHAGEDDLVGFLASGPVARGVADSQGLRHWHRVSNTHLDFSLQAPQTDDRAAAAVKAVVAAPAWDESMFESALGTLRTQLEIARRPPEAIDPGPYRVYLGPMAVADLLACMAWSGFSRRDRETGTSSLSALVESGQTLSRQFSLDEAPHEGLAPSFTGDGFVRPARLALVSAGEPSGILVCPRSAAEFGVPSNADDHEMPGSMVMAGGDIAANDMLSALGDGLWIENIWYLNYSDRRASRVTGMSRFASFIVKNGRLHAPLAPMRFDDNLSRLFGAGLQSLSRETTLLPDGSTWGNRSLNAVRCPGMLVNGMRFTL